MPRNSAMFWNVRATPRAAMRLGALSVTSTPSSMMRPVSGW